LWHQISQAALTSPLQPTLLERLFGNHSASQSAGFVFFELMTRLFSPYEFNPLNRNPLREVLLDSIEFDALSPTICPIKLFLAATNVRTGKIRVFDNSEIGVDAVLASTCLPFLFQAVEIDGEAYWDGGYAGNPAIFPLIYNCSSPDVLIVQLSPVRRDELPHSSMEILNRVNEISFNSSLLREMRAIHFVTRLIDDGTVVDSSLRRMRIHCVAADDVISKLSITSKLDADWDFLTSLRDAGRARGLSNGSTRISNMSVSNLPWISKPSTCDRRQCGAGPKVFLRASGRPLVGATIRTFSRPWFNPTKGNHDAVRQRIRLNSKIVTSIDSARKPTTARSTSLDEDKAYVYPLLIWFAGGPGGALPPHGDGFACVCCYDRWSGTRTARQQRARL
jgi:predicted acylesterase/phospholipase RssA